MNKLTANDIEKMFLFLLYQLPKVWGKEDQKLRDKRIIQQIRNLRKIK